MHDVDESDVLHVVPLHTELFEVVGQCREEAASVTR